jgi:hypothetical protein
LLAVVVVVRLLMVQQLVLAVVQVVIERTKQVRQVAAVVQPKQCFLLL